MIFSPYGCSDTCKHILARHIHVAYEKWHIIPCAIIIIHTYFNYYCEYCCNKNMHLYNIHNDAALCQCSHFPKSLTCLCQTSWVVVCFLSNSSG